MMELAELSLHILGVDVVIEAVGLSEITQGSKLG